eukprot:gene4650-2333_t
MGKKSKKAAERRDKFYDKAKQMGFRVGVTKEKEVPRADEEHWECVNDEFRETFSRTDFDHHPPLWESFSGNPRISSPTGDI